MKILKQKLPHRLGINDKPAPTLPYLGGHCVVQGGRWLWLALMATQLNEGKCGV